MKLIKKKMIWFGIFMVAGILLSAVGIFKEVTNPALYSISVALIVMGGIRLISYYKISKDEEKLAKFNIAQTEERSVFLSNKSGNWAFWFSVWGEFLTMLVALFLGYDFIAALLGFLICFQTLLLVISFFILNKKY